MIDLNMAAMTAELERDEGKRACVYRDSLGFFTIGVGFLVDDRKAGSGLTDDEIAYILANRINAAVDDIGGEPWFQACGTDARRRALVNMRFQLGGDGLRQFKNSLALIVAKDWEGAADHMLQSLWAQQTPERAKRVTQQIRTGV